MSVVKREVEVEKALILGEVRRARLLGRERLEGRVRARNKDCGGNGGIVD